MISECPFCHHKPTDSGDNCGHFQGWTDNGKTLVSCGVKVIERNLDSDDVIVKTGVTARVYSLTKNNNDL